MGVFVVTAEVIVIYYRPAKITYLNGVSYRLYDDLEVLDANSTAEKVRGFLFHAYSLYENYDGDAGTLGQSVSQPATQSHSYYTQ